MHERLAYGGRRRVREDHRVGQPLRELNRDRGACAPSSFGEPFGLLANELPQLLRLELLAAASNRPTGPATAPTPGRLAASSRPASRRRASSASPLAASSSAISTSASTALRAIQLPPTFWACRSSWTRSPRIVGTAPLSQ